GYTSLFGNVRTAELIMRWTEMAAFTPVMRTHEGNRPRDNLQIDQDEAVLAHFARMTTVYVALAPYLKSLSAEAARTGLPVQRPLFLHYENDRQTYAIQDSYLYGPDMLVAPVWKAGETQRTLYLPGDGQWVHLWSGVHHRGGNEVTVEAPLGRPAVFYRADSANVTLFEQLRTI
ncbi:MAG TPA: alpha-glucosidase, partial [Agrobacterium sp.]|nr:alpha-glucosidase [Agrobacterium sp.]